MKFLLYIQKSCIDGRGCFAGQRIIARKKIGNLAGEIIHIVEARNRVKKQRRVTIVEFGNGFALDASVNSNEFRFVNHSCQPNIYMRCCNNRVEFYALRNIKKGEELTCNYGETHHDGKLTCKCGAPNCKGAI